MARIYRDTPRNLGLLAAALRRGELVGVPTETVYGLAANALDPEACRNVFAVKGRPGNDPLIVHVHSWRQVGLLAQPNCAARMLARRFWPGPLTLVMPRRDIVDDIVTSGLSTVAVRMPGHPLLRSLLRLCGLPLAAPSANPFGYISPTTAEHVRAGLGDRIRHILDGGPCSIGLESTIVDVRDEERPVVLRPGAISREQIASVLGRSVGLANRARSRGGARGTAMLAPGLLSRHYSPRTPLVLHDAVSREDWEKSPRREAWLLLSRPAGSRLPANVHWLDPKGSLRGVARSLFARLRELDSAGIDRIHVELARGQGLAEAINDRLRRAASKG